VCCGGSGILLEARRRVFPVEHAALASVSVICHDRRQIQSVGLFSPFFLFALLFWSLLEHEVYKKHCSVTDLVRPMLMKRTKGGTGWFSAGVLVFYICSVFLL
jgi:hypothetical protein